MKKYMFAIAIMAIIIGGFFAYSFIFLDFNKTKNITGNIISESASAEDIYSMFLCLCCGQALDKKNICCGMAGEMISYIDSQLTAGLSKSDVVIKTANVYGINSVIESKRDAVKAELMKQNPGVFPESKISFEQAVGKKAPDFELESIDGKKIKLSNFKGKNIVLFFNEGSMCYPACWDQIASLGNDARFDTDDTVAFSIQVDQKSDWEKIVSQVPKLSKAKILFDSTRAVSSAYDVLSLKSSMHKGNYPGHTFFIIDKEGVIRYILDDPAMAIRNDVLVNELEKLR